jgi:hypothetical protein
LGVLTEARNNAVSSLFITSFWLLSLTSYYNELSRQQSLEYLTAYLLLNEAYQTQASCHNEDSCRLPISLPWTNKFEELDLTVVEKLPPPPEARVIRSALTAKNTHLPFSRSLLVAENSHYYVATGITTALIAIFPNKFEITS